MKKLFQIKMIVTVVACFLISACAVKTMPANEYARQDKIAVISNLDNNFNKVFIGTTIFTNKHETINVASWQVNQFIANNIAKKLSQQGKKTWVINDPKVKQAIINKDGRFLFNSTAQSINADLLVIVTPTYQHDNYPFFPAGIGLYEKALIGFHQRLLYASLYFEVYSLKDGQRKALFLVHPDGSLVEKQSAKVPFKQLTNQDILNLKEKVYQLLNKINDKALAKMGLLPQ